MIEAFTLRNYEKKPKERKNKEQKSVKLNTKTTEEISGVKVLLL